MRSVLFKVFGLPIYAFGAAICLSFMQAFWLVRFLVARDRRDPPFPKDATEEQKKAFLEWIYDLGFGAMVGAIVGARIFHVLFEGQGQKYIDHPLEFFKVWNGGLVWYGGFIGAFLTCLWMVVRKKIHPWQLGDFVAPAISFGYAIGRLGCFMNGCCYGRPSEKWGVVFEEIGDHVHRIPTQLYESASGLAIGCFLIWLLPRRKFRGQVWWAYVSLYAVARFTVEIWRDDPRGEYGPLMTSQWIALIMFPIGVAMYFYQRARGRIPAPPVAVEKS